MKTTKVLAAWALVWALAPALVFAAEEPDKKPSTKQEDYSFQAGAPAPAPIQSPRLSTGGEDYGYGMPEAIVPATELVDASNALEGAHRRAQAQALQANDTLIDRNPDRNSPDKDRIYLTTGRFVTGTVRKKDVAGIWMESGGAQTFYAWPELGRAADAQQNEKNATGR